MNIHIKLKWMFKTKSHFGHWHTKPYSNQNQADEMYRVRVTFNFTMNETTYTSVQIHICVCTFVCLFAVQTFGRINREKICEWNGKCESDSTSESGSDTKIMAAKLRTACEQSQSCWGTTCMSLVAQIERNRARRNCCYYCWLDNDENIVHIIKLLKVIKYSHDILIICMHVHLYISGLNMIPLAVVAIWPILSKHSERLECAASQISIRAFI